MSTTNLIFKRLLNTTMNHRVSFNLKHLAQGSKCPHVSRDKMVLYNMRFCPYAERSVLVLLAKKLPFEMININLKNKPDWFLAKNPDGTKVPVLEIQGKIITESLVIGEYLDEKFPENRKLLPGNLEERARDRELMELSKKMYGPMHKSIRASGEEELKEIMEQVYKGLDIFEKDLKRRKTKFFKGDEYPGMLDYVIWPWFERLPVFLRNHKLPDHRFRFMIKWIGDMRSDDAVKTYALSPSDHARFLKGLVEGCQNYDLLYEEEQQQSSKL